MKQLFIISAFLTFFALNSSAQNRLAAKEAVRNLGKTVTVCDKVFSIKRLHGSNSTLLRLGSSDNKYLTVVVQGVKNARIHWHPETALNGKAVCVTGTVITYEGKPGILVTDNAQVKLDVNASN